MDPRKQAICDALAAFIRQRPGLEFANYGDVSSYRAEQRSIARDKREAETLLAAVRWRDSITAGMLLEAARSAYSGRLTIIPPMEGRISGEREADKHWRIGYVTGQYWPTEYRRAVCAVLASALWTWQREDMPAPQTYRVEWQDGSKSQFLSPAEVDDYIAKRAGTDRGYAYKTAHYDATATCPAGDWLRAKFRKEFGKGLASRWFR